MMAPLPNPPPQPDRPDLPRVRLDVRAGAGRPASYDVLTDEFLIGGAPGCDLRLTAVGVPPVVCQITRRPDGVRVRRLAPAAAVLLNDAPLPPNTPVPVEHADRLTVAGTDIELSVAHPGPVLLRPKLVKFEEPNPGGHAPDVTALRDEVRRLDVRRRELDDEEAARRAEWDRRDAELVRRQRALDDQAEELEADRRLWYGRRQQYEQEMAAGGSAAARAANLDAREAEVERSRAELVAYREELVRQHQAGHDQLTRSQELVRESHARLEADRAAVEPKRAELQGQQAALAAAFGDLSRQRDAVAAERDLIAAERERLTKLEAELAARSAQYDEREGQLRADRETFDRDRQELAADLLRLDRRRAEADDRDAASAARLARLRDDAAEWEATVRIAAEEEVRLREEADRLARQRDELDEQTARLADRAAQLDAQQGVLAVLRAQLDRTRAEVEREAVALAVARGREVESQDVLQARIREAEQLRDELSTARESADQDRRRLDERDSLLSAGLEEIRQQKEAVAAEAARLQQKEAELDARSAEFADQAGALKGRTAQALDLQARLEADRVAVREREAALTRAEEARQALQEQLRRRAEELAAKARSLDTLAQKAAAVEEARAAVDARTAEVDRLAQTVADREAAVARQLDRLKEVGRAVAAERKEYAGLRTQFDADRAAAAADAARARDELEAHRRRATAEFAALKAEAPELEARGRAAGERVAAAREVLRNHLLELTAFAAQTRADLDAARAQVRQDADRVRADEAALDRARGEHRQAVAAFRQQIVDWQGTVAEMRRALADGAAREAAVGEAARRVDATSQQLAERAEQLERDRAEVAGRRTEVERHLTDMREWYRRKLRELAAGGPQPAEPTPQPSIDNLQSSIPADEVEPVDRQLGELLRSLDLVDADTLAALWAEAGRQRRTLRQVLLASGAVTLYQLALIEAGNLGGLVLGRFRVIDRLRATPRETLYRVFDPSRPGGVYLLRHLAEAEAQDAVRPDEFRQRFAAARDAAHPHLAAVLEVLDVGGRPAALVEWPAGLFAPDWPPQAGHPGCWVRLARAAADGMAAAHRAGLVHGRLTAEAVLLTPAGVLKLTGFGEPPWLAAGPGDADPSPAADLRALGRVLAGWADPGGKKRGGRGARPYPDALAAVVRRLAADPAPPMADTVAADRPYTSVGELVEELDRAARGVPAGDDAWDKLVRQVADAAPDAPPGPRAAA